MAVSSLAGDAGREGEGVDAGEDNEERDERGVAGGGGVGARSVMHAACPGVSTGPGERGPSSCGSGCRRRDRGATGVTISVSADGGTPGAGAGQPSRTASRFRASASVVNR